MNDPHLIYPCLYTLLQVFLQEGWDLLGGKGMQVYAIPDGNLYRILVVMAFPRHPNRAPGGPLFVAIGANFPRHYGKKGQRQTLPHNATF